MQSHVSQHADESCTGHRTEASQAGGLSRCSTPDILAEVWLHEGEVGAQALSNVSRHS